VFDQGAMSPVMILLVNGRNVRLTGGLATPLAAQDEVSVFPMVAGG
jgi:molybdopterin converting factor small subunit